MDDSLTPILSRGRRRVIEKGGAIIGLRQLAHSSAFLGCYGACGRPTLGMWSLARGSLGRAVMKAPAKPFLHQAANSANTATTIPPWSLLVERRMGLARRQRDQLRLVRKFRESLTGFTRRGLVMLSMSTQLDSQRFRATAYSCLHM